MAVLPPNSSHAIPKCYKPLMFDPNSEIIDFYPTSFAIDMEGKAQAWLAEVLLPFIDEDRY
jgi:5'-3' exoribonuclease 2